MTNFYQTLADVVLVVHVVFVAFIIFGLIAVIVGGFAKWPWVRNPWFRFLHLVGIAIIVGQAWAGVICPLTTYEKWLREQAGLAVYEGSFIQHWLHAILFYDGPPWVFTASYSVFGLLVLLTFIWLPPRMGACQQ